MKILVVGASGYIGRHVVKNLADQGAEVIAFDIAPPSPNWIVPGVEFIQGNMANLEEVMSAVVDHGVQRMIALGYFMTPLLAPECRDLLNAARVNISSPARLEPSVTKTATDRNQSLRTPSHERRRASMV